ncbi:MAG: bifunctional phosphopantothenoylcysteine decarboxylase/phosphopantothenate--cysteine ligase CoaBC [Bernardetiaceae bacterium]
MRLLLAVTGGIAAYKTPFLVRMWVKAGHEVQVLMTESAHTFVSPLTLATLSGNPVLTDFQADTRTGVWNNHVKLGLWADAMVIAPATAHTLAQMAQGICDNLVMATYLSARCPVFFAPAMDMDMLRHPSTQTNIATLQRFGNHLIPSGVGALASGLHGEGRMAEPEEIATQIDDFFVASSSFLKGKQILITAGPTREPLDPVRFLSNHSTGKMGYALAEEALHLGAEVHLVTGPTTLTPPTGEGLRLVSVETAEQMHQAALERAPDADVIVLSAAVADYRPALVHHQKIKKQGDTLTLNLVRTPDIAASLGAQKKPHQRIVGFALETDNERANALKKLHHKNFDLIVLNSLQDAGAGFGHDTNRVTLLTPDEEWSYPLQTKKQLAKEIWRRIQAQFFG